MPVSTIGFMLKPSGFFDGNPALDMPPGRTERLSHRLRAARGRAAWGMA